MDINQMGMRYEQLNRQVLDKGKELQAYDDTEMDLFKGPGDVYVKDMPVEGSSVVITGNVQVNPETGAFNRIEIEEKDKNGQSSLYRYSPEENEKGSGKVILKKTDTHKEMISVFNGNNGVTSVTVEETDFVEASLSPMINKKADEVKDRVLNLARQVELLDGSEQDLDKAPGAVTVDKAVVFDSDGSKINVSGTLASGSEGQIQSAELLKMEEGNVSGEFIIRGAKDSDYYKVVEPGSGKSAQIYDREEPKLILYQQSDSIKFRQ